MVEPDDIATELILVDDGSTDGSWEAIEALVKATRACAA